MDRATALKAAGDIAEVARTHADESERGRRMAAPIVEAFEASGLAGLVMPTALGGAALEPSVLAEVVETVAAADSSAGWCTGIGIGGNALAAVLHPSVAKELFTDPTRGGVGIFMPGGRLTPSGDGLELNGRWSFASNCHQASVGSFGAFRMTENGPAMGPDGSPIVEIAFTTSDNFTIDETWDMTGMRGTGSHDVVMSGVQLSEGHVADLLGPRWPDDALFRLRMFDILGPCLSSVPLGIGRHALDVVRAHVADHGDDPQRGPRPPFGVDVAGQMAFGQAEIRLRAARTFLFDKLDEAYEVALTGDRPPRATSAAIGLAGLEALAAGHFAVDTACRMMGTAASREGAPLDRMRRDIISASGHVMFSPSHAAPLGRQLAGMYTVAPPFLPPEE